MDADLRQDQLGRELGLSGDLVADIETGRANCETTRVKDDLRRAFVFAPPPFDR
jgi:hypothetical protein